MTTRLWVVVLAAAGATSLAAGATIYVPAEESTIQAAVDAASDGDEILVAPGTYTGSGDSVINPGGKAITIRATGTADETIVDGEGARMVVWCNGGEGANTVIEGFTITGGEASNGGGVFCEDHSSPTLTDCKISGNTASIGGGICCFDHSSPTLTDCDITGNTGTFTGGGISCSFSSPTLVNCEISGNTVENHGGGTHFYLNSSPTLNGCTISGNTASTGGGVSCESSSPTLRGCTIVGNTASAAGGGCLAMTTAVPHSATARSRAILPSPAGGFLAMTAAVPRSSTLRSVETSQVRCQEPGPTGVGHSSGTNARTAMPMASKTETTS